MCMLPLTRYVRGQRELPDRLEYMRDAGAVISCTETVLFQLLERRGQMSSRHIQKDK